MKDKTFYKLCNIINDSALLTYDEIMVLVEKLEKYFNITLKRKK